METIKIGDETYRRLGVHARGFETPDSVITRLLDYFDQQGLSELPDAQSSASAPTRLQGKSYSKYEFEGQMLGKGRLVLAVIKSYCKKHPDVTFRELIEAFPNHLQGSIGVVAPISKAIEIVERSPRKQRRHFIKPSEIIKISDGDVAVCTEWGSGNIDNFVDHAEMLGFRINLADNS